MKIPCLKVFIFLQSKGFEIAFDLLVRDADVTQRDLRMGVIEDILQLGNVFKLLVMPIAERFAQGMRADAIRHIDHLGRLVELAVGLNPRNGVLSLPARKQPLCAV